MLPMSFLFEKNAQILFVDLLGVRIERRASAIGRTSPADRSGGSSVPFSTPCAPANSRIPFGRERCVVSTIGARGAPSRGPRCAGKRLFRRRAFGNRACVVLVLSALRFMCVCSATIRNHIVHRHEHILCFSVPAAFNPGTHSCPLAAPTHRAWIVVVARGVRHVIGPRACA